MAAKKGIDKNKVYDMRLSGMGFTTIAKEVGCTPARVHAIVKEMSPKQKPPIDKGKVGALRRAGWSIADIAADMSREEYEVIQALRAS